MNRAADRRAEDKAGTIAPLLVICVAIGLIFLPMACGLSPKIEFGFRPSRPF